MTKATAMRLAGVRLRIWLWRHGFAMPLAAALLVAAALLHWSVAVPADEQARAWHSHADRAAALRGTPPQPDAIDDKARLIALRAALPPPASAMPLVRRMAALAEAQQIAVQQADYQQQAHPALQVTQWHITQPVRATYPQVRRYIESVLRAIPNASLDQVTVRRDNVGQSQLEVRLRWSLWVQAPAPDAGAGT
jgi:hypothetical protein